MRLLINIYLTILGIKFTIKVKYNRFHVAFTHMGKRISRSTGLEATKKNLITVKKVVLPQIAQELVAQVQSSDTTAVANPDEEYLENIAEIHFSLHKEKVRDHVYNRDLRNYQNHILPYFKNRKLGKIKAFELEQWQNRLLQRYKPLTVQKYRSIFYGIYTRALQNELVVKNPLDLVTAPKIKDTFKSIDQSDKINPFSQEEIDTLVAADDDTYMPNFIKLMAYTGMRPGEMIALRWIDLDFKMKSISINKTTINGSIGLPKTPSSVRVIDMIQGAYEALQAQFILTGEREFVFVNIKNQMFYNHDIININFRKRLIDQGIPVRPLYQLRHSFASRMIKKGISLPWLSVTLGHKNSAITLSVYTKYIIEDQNTRLSNIDKINQQLKSS